MFFRVEALNRRPWRLNGLMKILKASSMRQRRLSLEIKFVRVIATSKLFFFYSSNVLNDRSSSDNALIMQIDSLFLAKKNSFDDFFTASIFRAIVSRAID
jgi:hypothetical protein